MDGKTKNPSQATLDEIQKDIERLWKHTERLLAQDGAHLSSFERGPAHVILFEFLRYLHTYKESGLALEIAKNARRYLHNVARTHDRPYLT